MASSLGIGITALTSKVGILSRKASKRLAIELGEKVLQRKTELGRSLTKEEIEQVFADVLPKRCRPKIITTEAEVRECLSREGLNEEQINEQLVTCRNNYMAAANVHNGMQRLPIYIPAEGELKYPDAVKRLLDIESPALIAHEMEHSLEKNCRVRDIYKRKTSGIRKFLGKLFDKKYMDKLNDREIAIHEYEGKLQSSLQRVLEYNPETDIMKMNCEPTLEGISEKIFPDGDGNLVDKLRKIMREIYSSGLNMGSENNKRLKLMKYWMDMEQPAYEITGQIERKIYGLKEGEYAVNTGIAKGYEVSFDIAKKERKIYWINKLLGRLKKPNIYVTDKDIMRYATNKEEKEIMTDMISNMEKEQKKSLIKWLYSNQSQKGSIKSFQQFLEATKQDGKYLYTNFKCLEGIPSEVLTNPDFIKIAKLSRANIDGMPAYEYSLNHISKCTPEQIREFAKIADTKEVIKNNLVEIPPEVAAELDKFLGQAEKKVETDIINPLDKERVQYSYRYVMLSECIDHPNYKDLKAFADIKMGDAYPYADIVAGISRLPSERIKANLEQAQTLAKKGKSIFTDICHEIDKVTEPLRLNVNLTTAK